MFLLPKKLPSDAEHTGAYVSSCRAGVTRNLPFATKKISLRKRGKFKACDGRRRGAYRSVCEQLPSERNAEFALLRKEITI